MVKTLSIILALGSVAIAPVTAQTIPSAVIADPAPDLEHPAKLIQLRYASAGIALPARLFLASGGKPHPTVLMLHGFPGTEMNFDLDRAIQRVGWNVLAIEYRGVWGGGGKFSFSHTIEDAQAGLAWLRDPGNDAKYLIDPKTIVVIGHSMGGFDTVMLSGDKQVAGSVVISGADLGGHLAGLTVADAKGHKSEDWADDASYTNMTLEEMVGDAAANKDHWDWRTNAARLAGRPLMVLTSNDGLKPEGDALASAAAPGGKVAAMHIDTDHSYNDHRIALAAAIVGWLQASFP